jgi:UDP-GlcNAc:undecaprenyl-phosphate/decaprenyl-phosphate GlcNAc-1-phosphate transferase
MKYLSALVLTMFTTIALIPILRDLGGKYLAMDIPGGRKIHQRPISKSGGIAMALGALLPILLWTPRSPFIVSILVGSWIIIIFGLIDDFKDLPYGIKFLGQIIATIVVIYYGGLKIRNLGELLPGISVLPDIAAIPLTMFVIVGVTNAINLSDGLDGLAGGISLLSFICIGYLAFINRDRGILMVCATMIGAIVGFLRYNTYPASIFMGDTGSQLLGFLAVTLSLDISQNGYHITPLLPILIMGLPIMDTLRVMGDRMLHGNMPFKPDTRHLHHRLMNIGMYHTEAVLTIYCLHATLVTFAFIFRAHSDWFVLMIYIAFSLLIILALSAGDRFKWQRGQNGFLDSRIKTRLKWLKQNKIFIKFFFKLLETGTPLLLIVTCLVPSSIPFMISLIAAIFVGVIVILRISKPSWNGIALKMAIYIQVPIIIYQGAISPASWVNILVLRGYNVFFAMTAFIAILVLKFTLRKSGFKSTPMDFLILFIALVIPNIPDPQIRSYQLGMIAAKIICIYYGYEVLIGEIREDFKRLSYVTTLTLLLICGRGFLGV